MADADWDVVDHKPISEWDVVSSAPQGGGLAGLIRGDQKQDPGLLGTALDVARSIPGGLAKGAISIMGLPGDLQQMIVGQKASPLSMPRSSDIANVVTAPTGGFYQPTTTPGKYAETISSFAPSALSPGSAATRISRMVVPGAASEAAGQLTEGTSLEPYARTAAALGGGLAQGLGEGVLAERAHSATIPTTQQVKQSANYQAFAQNPVSLTPEANAAMGDRFGQTAIRKAMAEAQINQEHHLVSEFQALLSPNKPTHVTTEAADKIGQAFDSLAENAGTPNEARGWQHRSDQMETSIQQTPAINNARNAWAQFRKSEILDKAITAARNSAGTPGGFGDIAQAIRREFLKITRSNQFGRFSPDEQDVIKQAANGTFTANALQQLGKFSPVRGIISRWAELGGVAAGQWPLAVGTAVGGELARQGSNLASARAARLASETVRSGAMPARQLERAIMENLLRSGTMSRAQPMQIPFMSMPEQQQ